MRGADKVICQAAAVLLLFSLTSMPARAQFAGLGGAGAGGQDMMTQTMGPMMGRMMENGGFGGMMGGSNFGGGFGAPNYGSYTPMGGSGYAPTGMGFGGGDIMGMLGGSGGADMMAMIPQLMRLANLGGGHRRHRHR